MKHLLLLLLFLTTSLTASSQETHVFLLAGQSNMVGRPTFDGGLPHPAGTLQWNSSNNTLIPAATPMQHHDASAGDMGLDVQFAIDYLAANPTVTLVLIPRAKGGTGFNTSGQWRVGDALYNSAVNETNACMAANPSFIFKGILWHQGERDRNNIPAYYAYYDNLINSMRNDINAADNTTPFICGGIMPDFISNNAGNSDIELVQAYIEDTPNRIQHTAYADNAGLTTFDGTHGDAASLRVFGTRYFQQLGNAVNNTCPITTEFKSGSWDNGVPDANKNVIFSQNYDITAANLEVCTCELINNAAVTVGAGEYLKVTRGITVNNGASLLVEHQGVVVQTDPTASVINKGVINVDVTTPVLQNRDFMVMGSPMDTETRSGVFTNAFLVLDHAPNNFNPNTHPNIPQGATNFSDLEGDFWSTYSGAINPGEGYIVRPQTGYGDPANVAYDMTYSLGTLNNGTVNRPMVYNNTNSPSGTPNVYANPYPSAIDADQFIQDNGLNALYFWEHLTPPSVIIPGQGLKFDMDDVSTRNFGGGTAANNDDPMNVPTNVISTGQGFAIKAVTQGTVSFTNDMRLTTGNSTLRSNEEQVDRLWLHIESDVFELANNMMIGFNPQATAGIDLGYDTDRLACSVSIYSQLETGDDRLSIQTRESFSDDMKIPVGFSTLIDEETSYTISLVNFEGDNLVDRAIYIYDTDLNILTDLTQGDYNFSSGITATAQDRRFTVVFEQDEEVLGTNDAWLENIAVYPNPTSGMLNIVSTSTQLEAIKINDVLGRQVSNESLDNVQGYQLDMSRLKASIYFVEIITPHGTIIKRIVKK